jgi:RimJ/RimL family protein N-acetyltransferase
MISFVVVNEKNKEDFLKMLPPDTREDAAEYTTGALECGYDEVALCYYEGMLLIRVYDGENYLFISPLPLRDGASEEEGIEKIREYAVKEDIPLFLSDVPIYLLDFVRDYFADVDYTVDEEGEAFDATVNSPADMCVRVPTFNTDRLTLAEITSDMAEDYFHLCTEKSGQKYYGYSYADDTERPTPDYFYERQLYDYTAGLAITLGVYYEGELVGECVLHHFDLLGGAEISIKLLPEFRGLGLGREILTAVIRHKRMLDIKTLYATVHIENTPSIRLFSSLMDEYKSEGSLLHYRI